MPGLPVVRIGDMCSGHQGATPRPAITGSPTVLVNGIPVVRVTDLWQQHSNHIGHSVEGSLTVFVNTLPLVRVTDQIDCGSKAATGSLTVFAG